MTFVKQVLLEKIADPSVLKRAVDTTKFDQQTKPVWAYLDRLRCTSMASRQEFSQRHCGNEEYAQ